MELLTSIKVTPTGLTWRGYEFTTLIETDEDIERFASDFIIKEDFPLKIIGLLSEGDLKVICKFIIR